MHRSESVSSSTPGSSRQLARGAQYRAQSRNSRTRRSGNPSFARSNSRSDTLTRPFSVPPDAAPAVGPLQQRFAEAFERTHQHIFLFTMSNSTGSLRPALARRLPLPIPGFPGYGTSCQILPGRLDRSRSTPKSWWRRTGLNRRPPACKAGALPLSYAPDRCALADGRKSGGPGKI